MEVYTDYYLLHKGINKNSSGAKELITVLKDRKTQAELVYFYSVIYYLYDVKADAIRIDVDSNEKTIKKLKLPFYKHKVTAEYTEGVDYRNRIKGKKNEQLPCLSLGPGGVAKVVREILKYWDARGYTFEYIDIYRATGVTAGKEYRAIKINPRLYKN